MGTGNWKLSLVCCTQGQGLACPKDGRYSSRVRMEGPAAGWKREEKGGGGEAERATFFG